MHDTIFLINHRWDIGLYTQGSIKLNGPGTIEIGVSNVHLSP